MVDEILALEKVLSEDETNKLMSSLMARIPAGAGSNKQQRYLAYRSTGFSVSQAAELCGTTPHYVRLWRKQNPAFKRLEDDYLPQLQSQVGNEVIRMEYLRNMRLLLAKDAQLFMEFYRDPDALGEREWEYFKLARKHYTPSDLLALEKILHPEKQIQTVNVRLSWGSSSTETLEAEYRETEEE